MSTPTGNSSFITITEDNKTFSTLQKGFNLRWPPSAGTGAKRIYVCKTPEEVLDAANEALSQGFRITVRSGAHCYEGFVSNQLNNENLAIIDVGELKGFSHDTDGNIQPLYKHDSHTPTHYQYAAFTGSQNWDGYVAMYKQSGKTIPGGSCYSVGLGGHISGGGYGLLSRLQGLTVDWVTGVDILIPDPANSSRSLVPVHVTPHSNLKLHRELFKACCGAGGGNFGIIIRYYFNDLPEAPQKAYWTTLSWDWSDFDTISFRTFLRGYHDWFAKNDSDATSPILSKANGGLFSLLKLNHIDANPKIILAIQYTGCDGLVGDHERDAPFNDFLSAINSAAPGHGKFYDGFVLPNIAPRPHSMAGRAISQASPGLLMDWFYITQMINGSGNNQRGKYKSAYQVDTFTDEECDAFYNNLSTPSQHGTFSQSLVQIDSYGGRINSLGQGNTAVPQRKSILKSQYQTYWTDPAQDPIQLAWINKIYEDVHASQPNQRPGVEGRYEGCYINYPDVDMLVVNGRPDDSWLELYYGDSGLVDELISLKNQVDPNNLFRHQMSIPLTRDSQRR
ncbi:FAD-binding protein [Pseudomonas antarctica]|uniref:FAD-binding protein n=1 Tax=Pseudomonas antarctica TaxID=219572 RepID=A0A172YXZ0_9PSED|nr:BBE domain-containing protein [Pseudomonas antarctica]ANF85030.1 FAD-binding protein [Pseudomonas antarctica]